MLEVSSRGSPVVSVSSEVSASLSFQGASARSARSDAAPSTGNDSFAALVDSNTAAGNSDHRPQDTGAPAPRRADDPPSPSSDTRSRDNAAADKTARNNSDDSNAAADARDDANTNANAKTSAAADSKAAATREAKAKSA